MMLFLGLVFSQIDLVFAAPAEPAIQTKVDNTTTEIRADGTAVRTVETVGIIHPRQPRQYADLHDSGLRSGCEVQAHKRGSHRRQTELSRDPAEMLTSLHGSQMNFGISNLIKYIFPLPNIVMGSEIRFKYQIVTRPLIDGAFSTGSELSNLIQTQTYISDMPIKYVTKSFGQWFTVSESRSEGVSNRRAAQLESPLG